MEYTHIDGVKRAFDSFLLKAPQQALKDGDRNMTVKNFKNIRVNSILCKSDIIIGVACYPNGVIDDAYIIYIRNNLRFKAPLTERPIYHDYEDQNYWKGNQPQFESKTQHESQYYLWKDILSRENIAYLSVGI